MSRNVMIDVLARMNAERVCFVSAAGIEVVQQQLAQLAAADPLREKAAWNDRMEELAFSFGMATINRSKPFIYNDGMAIIPIHGMLINRFSYSWGFVTGYNFIRGQLNAALDDPDVERIVYDVNSYGGEAAGCAEICGDVTAGALQKPSMAMIDSNCCSAAYGAVCGVPRIVCTPSGQAGSIGAMATHFDLSGMYEQMGVKVTLIAQGAHKTDGNSFEPLQGDALDEAKAGIAKRYDEFVALVASNRSAKGLDDAAIRATESRVYRADDALAKNLIDAVQTSAQAVSSFLAEMGEDDPHVEDGDDEMAVKTEQEQAAEVQRAREEGMQAGKTAELQRVQGINGHAAAQKRPKLAATLIATGLSVEQAGPILEAAAEEVPSTAQAAPAPAQQQAAQQQAAPAAQQAAPAAQQPAGDGAGAFQQAMDAAGGAGVKPGPAAGAGGDEQSAKPIRGKQLADRMYGKRQRENA